MDLHATAVKRFSVSGLALLGISVPVGMEALPDYAIYFALMLGGALLSAGILFLIVDLWVRSQKSG